MAKLVGTLGPRGTFSGQVAEKYCGCLDFEMYPSISDVFLAVQDGKIRKGIVPIENSLNGEVLETKECLDSFSGRIVEVLELNIRQNLMTLRSVEKIDKIISHPQALAQCSEFIKANYPDAKLISSESTAAAVVRIVDKKIKNAAVIGSEGLASIYDLKVVRSNIEDKKKNITKFAVLSISKDVFAGLSVFKDKGNIGIIGGSGRMGQWALWLFSSLGYKNLFYSARSCDENLVKKIKDNTGARYIKDKRELAKISDLLIVSVSIGATSEVINEVGPYLKKGAIFSDFTSVKEEPCRCMAKYSKYAIGMHPMFKDSTKELSGKNIVITPMDEKKQVDRLDFLKRMFGETNVKIRVLSPKKHDCITAFNQAGIHLMFMIYGNLMKSYCRKNDVKVRELESLDTPNSKLINLLLGRFLATQNYDLMWGIQNLTGYSRDIRHLLLNQTSKMVELLEDNDKEQFNSDLKSVSRKFKKSRLKIDSEESDQLISSLSEFGTENYYDKLNKDIFLILSKMEELLRRIGVFLVGKTDENFLIISKMHSLFLSMKAFDKDYHESVRFASNFKRLIDKNILKGKRRFSDFVVSNKDDFLGMVVLCDKYMLKVNNLLELKKIIY